MPLLTRGLNPSPSSPRLFSNPSEPNSVRMTRRVSSATAVTLVIQPQEQEESVPQEHWQNINHSDDGGRLIRSKSTTSLAARFLI